MRTVWLLIQAFYVLKFRGIEFVWKRSVWGWGTSRHSVGLEFILAFVWIGFEWTNKEQRSHW